MEKMINNNGNKYNEDNNNNDHNNNDHNNNNDNSSNNIYVWIIRVRSETTNNNKDVFRTL